MLVWLDGIDNNGIDQHSTTTTTWSDLSGNNNSPTLYTGATATWNSNNFYFNNTLNTNFLFPTTMSQFENNSWTVETRINRADRSSKDIILCGINAVGGYQSFCIFFDAGYDKVCVYDGMYGLSDTKYYSTYDVTQGIATTISFTYTPGTLKFYKDGVLANTMSVNLTYTNNNYAQKSLGNHGGNLTQSSVAFGGNIYSLRIYSKVLTDAEIAGNYAIDQTRFQ